jgi:NAD(P)-dependent dehydrogenase (short-subunit alcohol dehydrogenase family)
MSSETSERVAVVTGASSGIGEATARLLATRGWRCVLVARREPVLHEIAGEIGADVEACDVSDRAAVRAMADRVLARHPSVHLVVNGAGVLVRGSFADVEPALVERVLAINYLGGVRVTRGLMPGLRRAARATGEAHVVDIASIGGTIVFTPAAPYSASKHAQVAYSRSLRAALHGTGIQVHTVLPGFVTTPGFPHPTVFSSRLGRRFVVGPERVAAELLAAVEQGKAEVVVPWFPYRLGAVAQALWPTLTTRVLRDADYPEGA